MTYLRKSFALLITVLLLPVLVIAASADDMEETDYISIEVVDAQTGVSLDIGEEYVFWNGIVTIEDLPPEEKELVILPGTSQNRKNVPNYFQNNYTDVRYGSGTIATSGCSITCLAMVAAYMTDHLYSPAELADYFGGSAYSNMARLETASDALQLPYTKAANWHESLQALKDGKVVIALMEESSVFTESQHFIVMTGITEDGKIFVNDPNLSNYARWELQKGFANGFDEGDILCGYSGGWIYDKNAMSGEPFLYWEEEPAVRECRYPGITLTQGDIDLLAKVVWVEAQGECFEGQQAVAEVVLNRLVSGDYPDTLTDVIYAEGQFRSVPFLEDATPWQVQYEAIERALYGPYVMPMDVMFFAQQPTNGNVWGKIGGHVFCYQEEIP